VFYSLVLGICRGAALTS